MNFTCVIPARGGSKQIPRKNLAMVKGKPLVQYSIDVAKKAYNIDKIIVSTDDEDIKQLALHLGVDVRDRPAKLGVDTANIRDVAVDATKDEFVCVLLPTYPFRSTEFLEDFLEEFQDTLAPSMLCGKPAITHPEVCLSPMPGHRAVPYCGRLVYRRQDRDDCFAVCHYVVAYRTSKVKHLDDGLVGRQTMYLRLEGTPIDIDTPQDLEWANAS